MHSSAHPQRHIIRDSAASIYSCTTYYSSAPPSFVPSTWWLLKSDIDRSLKMFQTEFESSCFDEMEDQLLENPLESFAAMCYHEAVAKTFISEPDHSAFIKPPNPVKWQEDEDTLDSDDSDSFVKFASVDPSEKLDNTLIQTSPTTDKSTRDISFTVTFPFLLHDPASSTVVPNPHDSIHYYPTPPKKSHARRNTLTNVLHRIKSFPTLVSPISSPT